MSDIELAIKIPEEYYENLLKNHRFSSEEIPIVSLAIAAGIPLPEGRGSKKEIEMKIEEIKVKLDKSNIDSDTLIELTRYLEGYQKIQEIMAKRPKDMISSNPTLRVINDVIEETKRYFK